jgi:hypothetical protein
MRNKKKTGGKIQTITSVMPQDNNPKANIDEVINKGAAMVYLHLDVFYRLIAWPYSLCCFSN